MQAAATRGRTSARTWFREDTRTTSEKLEITILRQSLRSSFTALSKRDAADRLPIRVLLDVPEDPNAHRIACDRLDPYRVVAALRPTGGSDAGAGLQKR